MHHVTCSLIKLNATDAEFSTFELTLCSVDKINACQVLSCCSFIFFQVPLYICAIIGLALFHQDLLYLIVHLCIIYRHKESILAFAGENELKCEIIIQLLTTKEQVNFDAWTNLCLSSVYIC